MRPKETGKLGSRKTIWPVALSLALLALTVMTLAGCGGSAGTTGKNGTVTESQLGAPVYPGATRVDASETQFMPGSRPGLSNGSTPRLPGSRPDWSSQGSAPRARGGSAVALWTPDSSTKVAAWYRDKLKGKAGFQERTFPAMGAAGVAPAIFSYKSGDSTKVVMVRAASQDKGGSYITVRTGQQGMPSRPPFNQGQ